MPFKICGKCSKQVGPRTQVCSCGYSFISKNVEIAKPVAKISIEGKKVAEKSNSKPADPVVKSSSNFSVFGKIAVPAGKCPILPEGYKKNWPDGPASDECVVNWATNVACLHDGRLTTEAVLYYAREFWDVNSKEYRERVHQLIFGALNPLSSEELARSDS